MIEKILAAACALACLVALARLWLKPRQRQRLDAWGRLLAHDLQGLSRRFKRGGMKQQDAARTAQEAIWRAAGRNPKRPGKVKRDGNVYRPDQFERPPRKPH